MARVHVIQDATLPKICVCVCALPKMCVCACVRVCVSVCARMCTLWNRCLFDLFSVQVLTGFAWVIPYTYTCILRTCIHISLYVWVLRDSAPVISLIPHTRTNKQTQTYTQTQTHAHTHVLDEPARCFEHDFMDFFSRISWHTHTHTYTHICIGWACTFLKAWFHGILFTYIMARIHVQIHTHIHTGSGWACTFFWTRFHGVLFTYIVVCDSCGVAPRRGGPLRLQYA